MLAPDDVAVLRDGVGFGASALACKTTTSPANRNRKGKRRMRFRPFGNSSSNLLRQIKGYSIAVTLLVPCCLSAAS
jgi:hypothetical protein